MQNNGHSELYSTVHHQSGKNQQQLLQLNFQKGKRIVHYSKICTNAVETAMNFHFRSALLPLIANATSLQSTAQVQHAIHEKSINYVQCIT